jgi:nitroreductase
MTTAAPSSFPPEADLPNSVDEAITSRRSVRAFLPTPVPRALVSHVLDVAARAPSGGNLQPWKVHVVMGDAKARLEADLLAAFEDPDRPAEGEYEYYPREWREPYLGRRRKVGWDLYALLGIGRRDLAAMQRQHGRNLAFFGAPVGLLFTMDRRLGTGSWLDVGMFMQGVMVAARGSGLHTCPQAAFVPFHRVVRERLGIPEEEILLCGMAMGYEDRSRPESRLRTEREPVEGFARFHGC